MTAFVSFIRTYATWIYLLCLLGILLSVKTLADARRLARTTLFSLEQERATEQTFRALIVIAVIAIVIFLVVVINVLLAPLVPPSESILRGSSPTLPAIVFPSSTAVPTISPTQPKPSETAFSTGTLVSVIATSTRPVKSPSLPATPMPSLPAPILTSPPNNNVFQGEGQMNGALTFKWTWNCDQCILGPNDGFIVVITYDDKNSSKPVIFGTGQMRDTFVRMADIVRGGTEMYQKAKEDKFQWFVQVKRGEQPISPPSDTWKFVWH